MIAKATLELNAYIFNSRYILCHTKKLKLFPRNMSGMLVFLLMKLKKHSSINDISGKNNNKFQFEIVF